MEEGRGVREEGQVREAEVILAFYCSEGSSLTVKSILASEALVALRGAGQKEMSQSASKG